MNVKNFTRRRFLGIATAAACGGCRSLFTGAAADFDETLSIFASDVHVSGSEPEYAYTTERLQAFVADVLRMTPLPRRIFFFGDLARFHGKREDYVRAIELIRPLRDAGIEIVMGLGNHDRHDYFFELFPEQAKSSPVPGAAVSVTRLAHCDFVMLDSLDDRSEGGTGGGRLSDAQQEWLKAELPRRSRPVLVGAHHGGYELKLGRYSLHGQLARMSAVKGYVFGHVHRWSAGYAAGYGWGGAQRVLRTVSLPSLGYWGDIGWAEFRTEPDKATVTLRQNDFFFARPVGWGEGVKTRPPEWDDIVAASRGASCVFRFK